jgi:hypothetical protein
MNIACLPEHLNAAQVGGVLRRGRARLLLGTIERAGMSEMDIFHRTRDIFLYFKLPFDAPPPEEE